MPGSSKIPSLSALIVILGLLAMLVGLIVMMLLPGIRLVAWSFLLLGVILLGGAFILSLIHISEPTRPY